MLIFFSDDDVLLYAENQHKILLLWDEKVIDVTDFILKHPGMND